jgi:hypothetical protein
MLNEDTYVPFPYFYDVTAFSGPLLNNVPGGYSGAKLAPRGRLLGEQSPTRTRRVAGAPNLGIWQVSEDSTSAIESAGWLRWYLDRRLQLLYADLTAPDITAAGLEGLDVLVIPSGSAEEAAATLGPAGQGALVDWVDAGGTLVTLRESSQLAGALGLTSATPAAPTSDVPGSLIRVEVDRSSPLGRGVGRTAYAMYEYDTVWSAPDAAAPVTYPEAGDPDWFVSGFAEGEEELHGTAAVVDEAYGDGRVVLFGFDPNYRAFTDGTAKMLRNAILGPPPEQPARVEQRRGVRPTGTAGSATDRLVLTVQRGAAPEVRALLARYGAEAETVTSSGRTSFRVDLGGLSSDEHPWARSLADAAAGLGEQVVAIRLP